MKHIILFLVLLLSMLSRAQANHFPERNYEQAQFDSDTTCCWRKLSYAKRHHEAALLIIDYINNSPNVANRQSLNWHAGQMFALANEVKPAINTLKKPIPFFTNGLAARMAGRGTTMQKVL